MEAKEKRQEIRELLAKINNGGCIYPPGSIKWKECPNGAKSDCSDCAFKELDELGLVIKVKKELPDITKQEVGEFLKKELGYGDIAIGLMRDDIAKYIRKKVKKLMTGFTTTEPLIEEEKTSGNAQNR